MESQGDPGNQHFTRCLTESRLNGLGKIGLTEHSKRVCTDEPEVRQREEQVCTDDPEVRQREEQVCTDDPEVRQREEQVCTDDPEVRQREEQVCTDDPEVRQSRQAFGANRCMIIGKVMKIRSKIGPTDSYKRVLANILSIKARP
jgi:hypothetical protein